MSENKKPSGELIPVQNLILNIIGQMIESCGLIPVSSALTQTSGFIFAWNPENYETVMWLMYDLAPDHATITSYPGHVSSNYANSEQALVSIEFPYTNGKVLTETLDTLHKNLQEEQQKKTTAR